MTFELRKTQITIDTTWHDGGSHRERPYIRAGICAVVKNPYAGKYVEDLQPAMETLKPLGLQLAQELLAAMACEASEIEAYGKGAIVGAAGELEHGALWHAPGGYAMRELLGETKAIVPSTKKVGAMGASIDIPLAHVNAAYVRSHFSTLELQVPDGPKPDELLLCLAMANGPRIHSRMGGLEASDIKGEDGLR